jgi:hypothetical protein
MLCPSPSKPSVLQHPIPVENNIQQKTSPTLQFIPQPMILTQKQVSRQNPCFHAHEQQPAINLYVVCFQLVKELPKDLTSTRTNLRNKAHSYFNTLSRRENPPLIEQDWGQMHHPLPSSQ